MAMLHQQRGSAQSMFADRLRPVDQFAVVNCCRSQGASDALQPLLSFTFGQEVATSQGWKDVSREAVDRTHVGRLLTL
jgi:hypothetical protein